MNSPYSSNLLQQPVEAPASPGGYEAPQHTRSVTRVVAAPQQQPYYAPQPQAQPVYVQAAPAGGGAGAAVSTVVLALVVILVGAVALVGAYYAAEQAAPSTDEAAITRGVAARQGFGAGRERGIVEGREDVLANGSSTTALRAAAARQRAYDVAYRNGVATGRRSYRRPVATGYRGGSGYRAPRFGGIGNIEVAAAFGQAQGLANLTGAPVDVEIYG